jgi:hypothetical protein
MNEPAIAPVPPFRSDKPPSLFLRFQLKAAASWSVLKLIHCARRLVALGASGSVVRASGEMRSFWRDGRAFFHCQSVLSWNSFSALVVWLRPVREPESHSGGESHWLSSPFRTFIKPVDWFRALRLAQFIGGFSTTTAGANEWHSEPTICSLKAGF